MPYSLREEIILILIFLILNKKGFKVWENFLKLDFKFGIKSTFRVHGILHYVTKMFSTRIKVKA